MRGKGRLKATIRDARHRARRALEQARRQVDETSGSAPAINVTGRANIVVTGNVGEDGTAKVASAEQTVAIRQSGPESSDQGER